jgi:hypothetical protein
MHEWGVAHRSTDGQGYEIAIEIRQIRQASDDVFVCYLRNREEQ